MLNETLRKGSSEAHHGLGCLSPCQDTFVQLFLSASLQCTKGFEVRIMKQEGCGFTAGLPAGGLCR